MNSKKQMLAIVGSDQSVENLWTSKVQKKAKLVTLFQFKVCKTEKKKFYI